MNNKSPSLFIKKLQKICGSSYILTKKWNKESYCKGWRYGNGKAALVIRPGSLIELWKTLEICNEFDVIIIMQAANTGLTGGSTPDGNNYDRPVVIINTMRIDAVSYTHLTLPTKRIV